MSPLIHWQVAAGRADELRQMELRTASVRFWRPFSRRKTAR
jgi:hypothetical protein